MLLLDAPDIGLGILEAERQLIGIETLRAPSEAAALQLLDDEPEPLDFPIAVLDGERHVADQGLQHVRVGGQIGEIELHVPLYSIAPLR